jgi:hypothetical protein
MRKHKRVDKSQIEAAIAAIRDRTSPSILQVSQRAEYVRLRQDLGKRLLKATIDNKTIGKLLTQEESGLHNVSQKQKKAPAKGFPKLDRNFQHALDNRKEALEQLANQPILTNPILLSEAEFVYANPGNILLAQTIAPMRNAAAVYIETPQNSTIPDTGPLPIVSPSVSFYFVWQNRSNDSLVISVETDLTVKGNVILQADQDGAVLWLPTGTFKVLFGETTIFPPPLNPSLGDEITAGSVLGSPSLVSQNVYATLHFAYSYIAIPAQTLVFFEVSFWPNYYTVDGYLVADFAFGDNYVLCPSVTIEGLRPPIPPINQT